MAVTLEQIIAKVIGHYRDTAAKRFDEYENYTGDHCDYCLRFIMPSGSVLDIGSGSGRDAAWFAEKGYRVSAVEPAHELRDMARQKHGDGIVWIDDALPDLKMLHGIQGHFDHIHLSGVLFHLPLSEIRPVFETLHPLLKIGGTLFIGLRNGPSDSDRPMFNVTPEWVAEQAAGLFTVIDRQEFKDGFQRQDVTWSRMMLRKDAR